MIALKWLILLLCSAFSQQQNVTDPPLPTSCAGRCGEGYIPGLPCYCNNDCKQFENCCHDYYAICEPDAVWYTEWQWDESHTYIEENHEYMFFEDGTISATDAQQRCIEHGGMLLSINSKEEFNFTYTMTLRKRTLSTFIGGSDIHEEGVWVWTDGTDVAMPSDTWSAWYEGEPDNAFGVEDCMVMTNFKFWAERRLIMDDYYWKDYSCDINAQEIQGYACERTRDCFPNPCQHNSTCQYVGESTARDMEYMCNCAEGYIGLHCEVQLSGEEYTECGPSLITDESGTLSSPLYPTRYPPLSRCHWVIEGEEGRTLTFELSHLSVELSKECRFDSLTIFDGTTTNHTMLLPPTCGDLDPVNGVSSSPITSSGNELLVVFNTDHNMESTGFSLNYWQEECGLGIGESGCQTRRFFTYRCGKIEISQSPLMLSEFCQWSITVDMGHFIKITFESFNIPDNDILCRDGALVVYDGDDHFQPVLGSFCGQRSSWVVYTTTRFAYIRLQGIVWNPDEGRNIEISYEAMDYLSIEIHNSPEKITGVSGEFSAVTTPLFSSSPDEIIQKWYIKVPYGDKLLLTWRIRSELTAAVNIYDGYSESSRLLKQEVRDSTFTGDAETWIRTEASSFQVFITLSRHANDHGFIFEGAYEAIEWYPIESGCYRPFYYSNHSSFVTENNLIRSLEPVIITVSERSYEHRDPGYENDLYCKWLIQSEHLQSLSLRFLDHDISPLEDGCASDGVVIFSGNTSSAQRYGPFCGTATYFEGEIESESGDFLVVFYSDSRGGFRNNGILRALVTESDLEGCDVFDMAESISVTHNDTGCGMMMSPQFPGLVEPNRWTWRIKSSQDLYLSLNVYYVVGPGIENECKDYFEILEISIDAGKLRQYEAALLKVCGHHELFVPPKKIKIPPSEQMEIILNTQSSSFYQRWQFKLSYTKELMEPPDTIREDPIRCREGYYYEGSCYKCPPSRGEGGLTEYLHYKGHCYVYELWTNRHYNASAYEWQSTWLQSRDQCELEMGEEEAYGEKSTLLTIKDEDEAYFIKYEMSHRWMVDPAGTYQTNHRLIFIGLHNRHEYYEWTDGTMMSYTDWYIPPEEWELPVLHRDSVVDDLLNLKQRQPNADTGSLCAVIIPVSPFGSLNWAKIPCDYPIFRAGTICKMPALLVSGRPVKDNGPMPQSILLAEQNDEITKCRKNWIFIDGSCYKLIADYSLIPVDNIESIYAYDEADITCRRVDGEVAAMTNTLFSVFLDYLNIWRHGLRMGDIWIDQVGDEGDCSAIQVYKNHHQDNPPSFRIVSTSCTGEDLKIASVLCKTTPYAYNETCMDHEFECSNRECVSVDYLCDGEIDCYDGSDELNCQSSHPNECDYDMYQCVDKTQCIPLAKYCDFRSDCDDDSDEYLCEHEQCSTDADFRCDNGQCIPNSNTCDFIKQCVDGSDEKSSLCENFCKVGHGSYQCFSGRCISAYLAKDLMSDCPGLIQEDEWDVRPELGTIFTLYYEDDRNDAHYHEGCKPITGEVTNSTTEEVAINATHFETITTWYTDNYTDYDSVSTHVQCQPGLTRCYERGDTCVYDTSIVDEERNYEIQETCRDGSHLRTMCATKQCPGMYHCPGSYCIPYSKVCNGIADCPLAQDEHNCHNYTCPRKFRCKGESFCISHENVCDGVTHCKMYEEDEKYCGLIDPLCDGFCECSGHVVHCAHRQLARLPIYTNQQNESRVIRAMLMSYNDLMLEPGSLNGLFWLGKLDLQGNKVSNLAEGIFSDLSNLYELILAYNQIPELTPSSFTGLSRLRRLDLSHNNIDVMRKTMFAALVRLRHLILEQNPLTDVSQDAFTLVPTLEILNTDAYKFCCIAPQAEQCTPEADEFSSCEDLMDNYALQVSIWVLGITAFVGNLFVVVWRVRTDRHKVSSFFIINLGISDFMMGVYMLIIASIDVYYRGTYIIHADNWRASGLCQLAGILSMLSSEVSVFMLTAITVDRAITILFPLKLGNFRLKSARRVAMIGWVVCFILTILPATKMSYFGDAFFGRTGVCLPFQLTNDKVAGWEYSVFIFLVLNLISFIIIFVGYVAIFYTVKSSMKELGASSSKAMDDYALAKKLAIIVVTDFLCWVPIILIGFAALGGASISPQVSAWVAVFILPLNSAVNPLLYTISAIDCSKKKKRPVSYTSSVATASKTQLTTMSASVAKKEERSTPT